MMSVLGSVSFDFGGEIQISIWNRNSHSVVDNMYGILQNYFLFLFFKYRPFEIKTFRAAWELEGSLSLATSFVKSDVEFRVGAEAKIDFVSDVSFGGNLMACLRMGQNGFLLK